MSLEFIEGFDHYTAAANMKLKWVAAGGDTVSNCHPNQAGRFAGSLAMMNDAGSTSNLASDGSYVGFSSVQIRYVGCAIKINTGANLPFLGFWDTTASRQVDLRYNSATSQLYVTRNGTTLGTLSGTYSQNVWYYLEIYVKIHSTTGEVTVRVNGVAQLTLTGVNTQNTGNATTNIVNFGNGSTSSSFGVTFDDMYILNAAGSANNGFLGDVRVITNLPSGDGATTNWTPNSGGTHYSRVNEGDPDGDTSYNSDATPGDIDLYTYPALANITGGVFGVQVTMFARKDDAGTRQTCPEIRSGSTNYDGNTATLTTSYAGYLQLYETNPNTSAAWTPSNVNSAQFGVKCVA